MPVQHAIWRVGRRPQPLAETTLAKEQLLEDMIVAEPQLLSDEWMIIGRQEDTGYGGRIDLLGIAPDGALVLIELKRDQTPRDVVAQALDYAAWVETLTADDVVAVYSRFAPGRNLQEDFRARFGNALEDDALNQSHQVIVVATALDARTERLIGYLSDRDIPINVMFFRVFDNGDEQLLSRAWLLDPARTQVNAAVTSGHDSEPWNGEFYHSFGHGPERSWQDAVDYGFISAGGGAWYTRTLQLLAPGDRVWVRVPGSGFVGVCRVTGRAEQSSSFTVSTRRGRELAVSVATRGSYCQDDRDPDHHEQFVPVRWLQTVALDNAISEVGLFGNQNTVCKPKTPKWRQTVLRLQTHFQNYDK